MGFIEKDKENFMMLNFLDKFLDNHNGFICGGCFKNIFNGEKLKDIDIFFRNERDFNNAIDYFDSVSVGFEGDDKGEELYQFYYENKKVKAYKHIESGIVLELCSNVYGTTEDVLNMFDFTITKFAYYKTANKATTKNGSTLTYKILCHSDFFEHLHLKRLVIDDEVRYPSSTLNRMFRYAKYGYLPCLETKQIIIEKLREMTDDELELGESLYDGID